GCGDRFWKGNTSRAGRLTTESGSAAPVNSQNARSTGSNSSAARLSATTSTNGRSTARRNKTTISALEDADSPVTLIRPALSRRWEATRLKAGNSSTSAKSSRTNGKSIHVYFSSLQPVAHARWQMAVRIQPGNRSPVKLVWSGRPRPLPLTLVLSSPQQRPGKASRPARSVDADLRTRKRAHVKTGGAHALICLGVF